MKKTVNTLLVGLAIFLGAAFLPNLSRADEVFIEGPPAFTVTYPKGSLPEKTDSPLQVWAVKTPEGVTIQAAVGDVIKGVELKDCAEKSYKPGLESYCNCKVKIKTNKEIELAGGTKAYYTELEWPWDQSTLITTVMVTVYKGEKVVFVTGHPWQNQEEPIKVVKSLKFK